MPKAILTNSNDYGFGVFIIDEKSQRFFEEHLDKVPGDLNKSVAIG